MERRNEVEEEDRRRGVDERGMPREGDDEETVVARTMTRSELASETKETVRYKETNKSLGRALRRERETSRPSLGRKPVVLRETSSLATTYFSSLGSGASLERAL